MLQAVTAGRLRSTFAAVTLALALSLASALVAVAPAVRIAHAESAYAPLELTMAVESQGIDLVNADRAASGLAPLQFDPSLATIARWRSEDMAARNYFSHDIGGYQVFQVLRDWGIAYRVAGENLAYNYYGQDAAAAQAERALMESPGHRANILRPDFTHVGIGVAVAADGRHLFTQLFKREW
jgi:uncharacterized protein YkwD